MNVEGDLRYVHPGEYAAFADAGSERRRQRFYRATIDQLRADHTAAGLPTFDDAYRAQWGEHASAGLRRASRGLGSKRTIRSLDRKPRRGHPHQRHALRTRWPRSKFHNTERRRHEQRHSRSACRAAPTRRFWTLSPIRKDRSGIAACRSTLKRPSAPISKPCWRATA